MARPGMLQLTGQRFGLLLVIARHDGLRWLVECDCGRRTLVATGSLTTGGTSSCGDTAHRRLTTPGYYAAHERLRTDRGPARSFSCVDCGLPARQWSYGHTDPDALGEAGVRYSLDQSHYFPRCVRCHKSLDLAHLRGRTLTAPARRVIQDTLWHHQGDELGDELGTTIGAREGDELGDELGTTIGARGSRTAPRATASPPCSPAPGETPVTAATDPASRPGRNPR